MLVSGALLPSRGALFPPLKSIGLSDCATRRAWVAFRKGVWQMPTILVLWRVQVKEMPEWQEHRYEGYRPIPADVTAFWRPALKNCPSKHYHPAANRALPAIIMGITGEVGKINGQRIALPRAFERVHPKDTSETRLWQEMLKSAKKSLQSDEILVVDTGVKINDLQEAGIENSEVRLATNFTARRNVLPDHVQGRKPKYGNLIRPLPRKHKGKTDGGCSSPVRSQHREHPAFTRIDASGWLHTAYHSMLFHVVRVLYCFQRISWLPTTFLPLLCRKLFVFLVRPSLDGGLPLLPLFLAI